MELKCPICGSRIVYHRYDDQHTYVKMPKDSDGSVTLDDVMNGNPHGFTQWECAGDADHELGDELMGFLDEEMTAAAEDVI